MGRYWPGLGSNFRPEFKKLPRVVTVGRSAKFVSNMRNAGQVFGLIPAFNVQFADTGSIADVRGNGVPTFTRATTAAVDDCDGIVRYAKSGEVRFKGLRRVENRILGHSNNLSNASWALITTGVGVAAIVTPNAGVAPDGTNTASRVQFNLGGGNLNTDRSSIQNAGLGGPAGVLASCYIKTVDGSIKVIGINTGLGGGDSETVVTINGTWQRITSGVPSVTLEGFRIGLRGSLGMSPNADVLIWGAQLENILGQIVQTPGDYVSVGVQLAPIYHGAAVDGVKYFPTVNNNVFQQNLIARSQQLDIAWGPVNATVSANVVTAPDGTLTADKLVENNGVGVAHLNATSAWTTAIGARYAFSIYAKAAERTKIQLGISSGMVTTTGANAFFTLTGSGTAVNLNNCDSVSITSVGDNWYRCVMTFTATAVGFVGSFVYLCDPTNSNVYTGDNVSGLYLWGGQIQQGSRAGTYVPTAAAPVTGGPVEELVGATIASATRKGYLADPQRTNLCLRSDNLSAGVWLLTNATTSPDVFIAPDGTPSADRLEETVTVGVHVLQQNFVKAAAAIQYTFSFFVKQYGTRNTFRCQINDTAAGASYADVDLTAGTISAVDSGFTGTTSSIKAYPNGWYYITLTGTSNAAAALQVLIQTTNPAGTINFAGTVTNGLGLWGLQLEQAGTASSSIPTVAATVTRNADILDYSLGTWYNIVTGTLYAEWEVYTVNEGNLHWAFAVDNAAQGQLASGQGIGIGNAAGFPGLFVYNNATQADIRMGVNTIINTRYKSAGVYALNDFQFANSGVLGAADNVGVLPAPILRAVIGIYTVAGLHLNGTVAEVRYYPYRLTDTQLQTLTT